MKYYLLTHVLLSLLLISVISPNLNASSGQSLNIQIQLDPDQEIFTGEERITAFFRNNYGRTIYLVRSTGGPVRPLEKWDGEQWRRVNTTGRRGTFTQAVSYNEIHPGRTYEMKFPRKRLEELGKEISGLYRFSVTITPDKNSDTRITIKSPEFHVLE
jgi:hypothetical protein